MCVCDLQKRRANLEPDEIEPISTSVLLNHAKTTYADIVQRMVRRYLFKQDRLKTDRLESGQRSLYIEDSYDLGLGG